MRVPTKAEDWRHCKEDGRWRAMVPHVGGCVLVALERVPGSGDWYVEYAEDWPDPAMTPPLKFTPLLPAGPFPSAEEAMRAGDQWCAAWAPRAVDVPGVYSLRMCLDGKIRMSPDEDNPADLDEALTPEQAQALGEALITLAAETRAIQERLRWLNSFSFVANRER